MNNFFEKIKKLLIIFSVILSFIFMLSSLIFFTGKDKGMGYFWLIFGLILLFLITKITGKRLLENFVGIILFSLSIILCFLFKDFKIIGWILIIFFIIYILKKISTISEEKRFQEDNRCPKCGKEWAMIDNGFKRISNGEKEMRSMARRNKKGKIIGYIDMPIEIVYKRNYRRCNSCGFEKYYDIKE